MISGPETKLATDYLKSKLDNRVVMDSWFTNEIVEPDGFLEFKSALPLMVEEVSCKGKIIYFVFYNEYRKFYILHSLPTLGAKTDNSCKWNLKLDTDENLWFCNSKREISSCIQFIAEERIFTGILNKIGPDILTDEFNLQIWDSLTKKYKNKNITSFLMNQNIISGCGSYIKCESLFYANISPIRKVGSLTDVEKEKLFEGLRIISRCAYVYKDDFYTQFKIYEQPHATKTKTPDGKITYWDENTQV